jgi:hypothetical protein
MRGHIAVTIECTGILAFIDPAIGITIGALPFTLITAVFAIDTVPFAMIGRMVAVIGMRRCNDAIIAYKNVWVIGGLTITIAIMIALIIAVSIDIIAGVLNHAVAVGQNRIIIIA